MLEMKKNFLFEKKRQKPWIFILMNISLVAALIIFVALILNFSNFTDRLQDNHSNILVVQENRPNFVEIFSKKNEIASLSTKYSVLYRDGVNRQMFVFSLPLREKDGDEYVLQNNKIYENSNGTFETQNNEFNVIFNKNSVCMTYSALKFFIQFNDVEIIEKDNYRTIYNEMKDAVKYTNAVNGMDLIVIPAYKGVSLELDLQNPLKNKRIEIELDINRLSYENDIAGYVIINQKNERTGMIYQGIIVDSENNFYPNNTIKIMEKNKKKYLTIDLSNLSTELNYPAKLSLNFDFYFEKILFNTSVYESMPKVNSVLNNVSVFDTINEKNNGYTYLKYNIKPFTPKNPSLIDSFQYNFYVMAVTDALEIEVYRLGKDWCSWDTNWRNKPSHREKIGEFILAKSGWHTMDLTDYVKKLIGRKYDKLSINSIVLKPKIGSKGYAILASTNNSSVPPYFEVNYRVS